MEHNYQFKYNRIFLRPLEARDIEELRILRNKNREFFFQSCQISEEQQKAWFQNYLSKNDDVMFAVELIDRPGEFIGAIAIYDINQTSGVAECGRTVLDKDKAPLKGIGTEVTAAACHVAFTQLGVKKIIAEILKSNKRILKVDTRAGFVVVGENGDNWCIEMTPDTIILPYIQ